MNIIGGATSGVTAVKAACTGGGRTAASFFDYALRGLEGVHRLFDLLLEKGWRCLYLVDNHYPGELDVPGGTVLRIDRRELSRLDVIDVFFVMDDACHAYPPESSVVAFFHSLDLEMAVREWEASLFEFCQPIRFADYLLVPYAGVNNLSRQRVEAICANVYPRGMLLRSGQYTLLPGGYMNIEALRHSIGDAQPDALVYAPTAGFVNHGYAEGGRFVRLLLSAFPDMPVIFRPHPKDVDTPENLAVIREHRDNALFEYDREPTNRRSLSRAQVLITDTSGIGLTFAAALSRQVVFASLDDRGGEPIPMAFGYEAHGERALVRAVRLALERGGEEGRRAIEAGVATLLNRPNTACSYVAEYIETIRRKETLDGWMTLNRGRADLGEESPEEVAEHVTRQLARLSDESTGDRRAVCQKVLARYFAAEKPESWDFLCFCHGRDVNFAALQHLVSFYQRKSLGDPGLGLLHWTFRQVFAGPKGFRFDDGELQRIFAPEEVALFTGKGAPFAIYGCGDAYMEYYRGPLLAFRPKNCLGFVDQAARNRGEKETDGYPIHGEDALCGLGCSRFFIASYSVARALSRIRTMLAR
jgi:hypothetical protein